jgi:hypothetical protein
VHAVTAHDFITRIQVVDEEAFLARGNAEVYQDIVVGAIPSALTILPYLCHVFRIGLVIPFLAGPVVIP